MSHQEAITDTTAETTRPSRRSRTLGARIASLVLKHGPESLLRRVENSQVRTIINSRGLEVSLLTNEEEIQEALDLEQEVWDEKSYGSLDVYAKYLPQSRIFGVYAGEKFVGVNRLFTGSPELPPFISEMPIDNPQLKQELIEGCENFKVEEYGTAAVKKEFRNNKIFLDLCRIAYRDATERGIAVWGIIMEPRRVQLMNRGLGFTFEQIGPAIDYQGDECAAHVMRFADVRQHMKATKPELYDWFVNQPLEN
jgi:hypothetical protein